MSSTRVLAAITLALMLVTPSRPAGATTVVAMTGDALLIRSSLIVHATCTDRHSYLDRQKRIVTRYTFAVTETLKGEHRGGMTLVMPGGETGGRRTVIPGLSPHAVGDEVVLFLGATSEVSGFTFPVGLDQGLYRVLNDPVRGKRVRRSLAGLEIIPAPGSVGGETLWPASASLKELKATVRNRLALLRKGR